MFDVEKISTALSKAYTELLKIEKVKHELLKIEEEVQIFMTLAASKDELSSDRDMIEFDLKMLEKCKIIMDQVKRNHNSLPIYFHQLYKELNETHNAREIHLKIKLNQLDKRRMNLFEEIENQEEAMINKSKFEDNKNPNNIKKTNLKGTEITIKPYSKKIIDIIKKVNLISEIDEILFTKPTRMDVVVENSSMKSTKSSKTKKKGQGIDIDKKTFTYEYFFYDVATIVEIINSNWDINLGDYLKRIVLGYSTFINKLKNQLKKINEYGITRFKEFSYLGYNLYNIDVIEKRECILDIISDIEQKNDLENDFIYRLKELFHNVETIRKQQFFPDGTIIEWNSDEQDLVALFDYLIGLRYITLKNMTKIQFFELVSKIFNIQITDPNSKSYHFSENQSPRNSDTIFDALKKEFIKRNDEIMSKK